MKAIDEKPVKSKKDVIPLAVCLFIVDGFLCIWAINTLFPLYAIEYGFWQVLAMTQLVVAFAGRNIVETLNDYINQ